MTKTELKEILGKGFNVAMLAEAFDCSIGRINELKCEPVEGQVYHKADINTDALYDFAIKHEVDLDAIDYASITAAKKKAEKVVIGVASITKFGVVVSVSKVGNTNAYMIKTPENEFIVKSLKEIQE